MPSIPVRAVAAAALAAIPAVHAAGADQIRIGVIGCGPRGRGAASQAVESAPNVQVTALADLFPEAIDQTLRVWADRPKDLYNIPRARCFAGWDAYKELLATDVNYVMLTTPPGFRPMHIKAAVEAGKHIYAEKALAVDPAGVRTVIAAGDVAARKGLGIVVGTWRRHAPSYVETVKRLRDGAIGRILSGQLYALQTGMAMVPRDPAWSDMEWQVRNFPYFTWLSGDIIVDQHVHQHDIANWVLGERPRWCVGVGGRQVHTGAIYGHTWDHFAVDYDYTSGARLTSVCRHMENTYARMSEVFQGTRGWADASGIIFSDGKLWKYDGPPGNHYTQMHADLINSVRAGKPINEAREVAESHLIAIMGRMSAYTGQLVRWSEALTSPLDLMPQKLGFGSLPTPLVAMPGR